MTVLADVAATVNRIVATQGVEDQARAAWAETVRDSEVARHGLYHEVVKASALGASDEQLSEATGRSVEWVLSTRTHFPLCSRALGCTRSVARGSPLAVDA